MGKARKFNILKDGHIYKSNLTVAEVAEEIGVSQVTIYKSFSENKTILKVFTVEIASEKSENADSYKPLPDNCNEEWINATSAFKNVKWVKAGGKKLEIR